MCSKRKAYLNNYIIFNLSSKTCEFPKTLTVCFNLRDRNNFKE